MPSQLWNRFHRLLLLPWIFFQSAYLFSFSYYLQINESYRWLNLHIRQRTQITDSTILKTHSDIPIFQYTYLANLSLLSANDPNSQLTINKVEKAQKCNDENDNVDKYCVDKVAKTFGSNILVNKFLFENFQNANLWCRANIFATLFSTSFC